MEKSKLIIFSSLLVVLISFGYYVYIKQQAIEPSPPNNKDGCENINVEEIKKQVEVIESNITKYTTSSKDIWGKSTEGGQQTNYASDSKTVLIRQTFYGETGKSEINYYLQNDRVFYFTKKNTEYTLPLSEDSSGKVKNVEVKDFYLDSNQDLCFWYSNQKLQPNDQDTKDLVNFLISGLQVK